MLIKGRDITLIEKIVTGEDIFGQPTHSEVEHVVKNVLIVVDEATGIATADGYHGKKQVATIAVPKGDTHHWEDSDVIWNGKRFTIYGLPKTADEYHIPLDWGKVYKAEHYE